MLKPIKLNTLLVMKVILAFVIFSYLWIKLYTLPWLPGLRFDVAEPKGKMEMVLERSDGSLVERTFDLEQLTFRPIQLYLQSIVSYQLPESNQLKEIDPLHPESIKTRRYIPFSITITVLTFMVFLYAFWELGRKLYSIRSDKLLYLALGMNSFLLVVPALLSLPGLFNYDTFNYMQAAGMYLPSAFSGYFFSTVVMVVLQQFPYPWIFLFANIVLILAAMLYLYYVASRLQTRKVYFIAAAIFYLYPANALMTLNAGRDTLSHWLLLLAMVETYLLFINFHASRRWSMIWTSTLIVFSCFLRQETIFYLPACLILVSALRAREFFRWSVITASAAIISLGLFNHSVRELTGMDDKVEAIYQTTAYINQVSSILMELYPKQLPPAVEKEFGPYLKYDYIYKYHEDYEIFVFHQGGVNHEASIEDYRQFRWASLKLMLSHPLIFLQNRLNVATYMFGLSSAWTHLYSDEYVRKVEPKHYNNQIKFEFSLEPDYKRYQPLAQPLMMFLRLVPHFPPPVFNSYWIPFLIILGCLITLRRAKWLRIILFVLAARTFLVFLIAPGGYFKYNYIIWLFALFALPIAIWEQRTSVDKVPGSD